LLAADAALRQRNPRLGLCAPAGDTARPTRRLAPGSSSSEGLPEKGRESGGHEMLEPVRYRGQAVGAGREQEGAGNRSALGNRAGKEPDEVQSPFQVGIGDPKRDACTPPQPVRIGLECPHKELRGQRPNPRAGSVSCPVGRRRVV
jgi:hypothetical protein